MFGKRVIADLITRSTDNETDRRRFLAQAGAVGLGAVGATAFGGMTAATAATEDDLAGGISDAAILNFALNLEYLEGEFYHRAAFGTGLSDSITRGGKGEFGQVTGGHAVPFKSKVVRNYAREIAGDETNHVAFLRSALGSAKVTRPAIDLKASFAFLGNAVGVKDFDPFHDDLQFLIGAFIFEDVGVTAYKGAAPLISNKTYLGAAAGILAVEAYHGGLIRTLLYGNAVASKANNAYFGIIDKISNLRDKVAGTEADQGIGNTSTSNLVPTDKNSIAFSRTPPEVLNIVFAAGGKGVTKGGFFPKGVNNPGVNSVFTQT